MATTETTRTGLSFRQWASFDAFRRRAKGRRAVAILSILIAAVAVSIAALNWNWLVAIGIAPVLLSVLPCLVMCGLGLCMANIGGETGNRAIGSAGADGLGDSNGATSDGLTTGDLSCRLEVGQHSPAISPTNDASIQLKEKDDA